MAIGGIATVLGLASSVAGIVLAIGNAFSDVPSFDVGADELPGDMFARVHKGERILTAEQNAALGRVPNAEVPGLVNAGMIAQIDRAYLYEGQKQMIDLLEEQVHKQDQLIDAMIANPGKVGAYFKNSKGRRPMSGTTAQLLR